MSYPEVGSSFIFGETPTGVLKRNRIQIKKVALPVKPPTPTIEGSRPPQTTDVLRIAVKSASPQATA